MREVLRGMRVEPSSAEKLATFFRSMTRRTLAQLAVGDRQIADYLASVLAEFTRTDQWLKLRGVQGRRLTSVVEILLARLGPDSSERMQSERALRKYVGDYTLFMSGLFRRFVERGGYLSYYLEEGKRSYRMVSKLDVDLYRPGFLIFEELSNRFESYAGALDYMRKCCFAPDAQEDPFAGFFKQIEKMVTTGRPCN